MTDATYKNYTGTHTDIVTVTVQQNGDTEIDMGIGTLSFRGSSVSQAVEFSNFMNYNNAELLSIDSDSMMTVKLSREVDLMEEAARYNSLRRWHGLDRR